MRVELPSGAWVDYRDQLKAKDKFAVEEAVTFRVAGSGGVQEASAGIMTRMRNALLARIITAWSYEGFPIPANSPMGADIIGEVMDIDDYNRLEEAVEPLMAKVGFSRGSETTSG